MSLTNEQITAKNFKDFYDRIRPLLNSQHYHVDRSGQELKTLYAGFSTDSADTDDQKYWTGVANTSLPFIKISGDFEMANSIITIPAHTKVKLDVSLSDETDTSNALYAWYDVDANIQLNLKQLLPYVTSNRSYSASGTWIWENNTNNEKHITFKLISFINAPKLRYRFCSMTVQEIGRIVDPIQYTANNDELEETPVGNIISYMGNSVPKHYLACDGTLYNIGTYKELEAFIIDEFGSVNYFGGDGTTTWAVPDLRGEFLRGSGTNPTTNMSGANVGVHQQGTDVVGAYFGSTRGIIYVGERLYHSNMPEKADNWVGNTGLSYNYGNVSTKTEESAYPETIGKGTSRPTNTSVLYCIKYESTYHVIVPSHMYKVNIPFSTVSSSASVYAIFDSTNIIGDTSLVDTTNNQFIAPMHGWYSVSFNTSQGSSRKCPATYLEKYEGGTKIEEIAIANGFNTGEDYYSGTISTTVYLKKNQTIKYRVHSTGALSGEASFCLLTTNYKDNIIAGGEVYSTEEQLVGTNTDGRPLYQKTFISTLPGANADKDLDIGASVQDGWVYTTYVHGDYNTSLMDNYWYVYVGKNNSTTPNKIRIHNSLAGWTDLPVTVTIQYTKTTDQANTYTYKNSLLLTRPDMWEPNTEYDFGGGLYGQRFIGTHSTAGASAKQLLASVNKIVDQGGQIKCPSWITAPCPFGWGSNFYGMAFIDSSNKLMFNVKTQTTETATYDIWVTYKK